MTDLSDTFKQNLLSEMSEQVSEPQQITAREAVRQCLKEIYQGRKRRIAWDVIAEAVCKSVESTYGVSISLAGYTTRRYYYELTNRGKRKRPKPRSRSTTKKSTAEGSKQTSASVLTTETTTQPAPTTAPVATPTPTPEPMARSPAAELEPELGVTPVVDKPVTTETPQAASTEELHPNRFRDRFKKVKNPKTTTGYENCKTL